VIINKDYSSKTKPQSRIADNNPRVIDFPYGRFILKKNVVVYQARWICTALVSEAILVLLAQEIVPCGKSLNDRICFGSRSCIIGQLSSENRPLCHQNTIHFLFLAWPPWRITLLWSTPSTTPYITARYLRQRRPFKPYRYGRYHKGGNRVVWRQAPEA
jgi:hypothetical protein